MDNWDSIPSRDSGFYLCHQVWGLRNPVFSEKVERAECETNHLFTMSAKVKKAWSYSFSALCALKAQAHRAALPEQWL